MYDDARTACTRAGLVQYEISNWARPGFESRHNRQYWLNKPFLGFGPGRMGQRGNAILECEARARVHPAHTAGPALRIPVFSRQRRIEVIDREMAMAEMMILRLRLVQEGLSLADFEEIFWFLHLMCSVRRLML
jgi:oxygen-independent coproporphyrinogen-3 oxidase